MKKTALMIAVVLIGLLMGAPVLAAQNTIYILPEDFKESLGTFTLVNGEKDSGNAYRNTALRGATDNNPLYTGVAQVNVEIPADGEYFVWVRSRDYDSSPGQRKFRVGINKTAFEKILGAHLQNGWVWELAGSAKLTKGISTVKVQDISAYYPRLDLIALTDDPNFQPPMETAQIDEQVAAYHMKPTGTVPDPLAVPLKPNQVYQDGMFYTFLNYKAFVNDPGTWTFEWDSGTRYKEQIMKGQTNQKPGETKPATVTIALPYDGDYTFFFRTRDYFDDQGTRWFTASLDGVKMEGRLGEHGNDGWAWEMKKLQNVKKGYHTLTINDDSAHYARLDCIAITNDAAFVPENTLIGTTMLEFEQPFEPWNVELEEKCPIDLEPIPAQIPVSDQRPDDEIAVRFNGKYLLFDQPPLIVDDRTLVPFRTIFESFGFQVGWNEKTQTATGVKGNLTIELILDDPFALVNGQKIEMEVPAATVEGRFLVPVRFISETLNAQIEWEEATSTVDIIYRIWK